MNGYEARQAAKAERYRQYQENAAKRAQAASDGARRIMDMIPMGQPILIGHHSERHARRDRDKIDRGFERAAEERDRAEKNGRRAAAIESDRAISSWDPEAAEKIQERIAELEAKQARMKAINVAIRKATDATMGDALRSLDLTDAEKADLTSAARFSGSKGYPGYALTNNNGNIRRLRERLTALARQQAAAPAGFIKAVPNKWAGRCEDCGAAVEPQAGFYASDADGNAAVHCAACMEEIGHG